LYWCWKKTAKNGEIVRKFSAFFRSISNCYRFIFKCQEQTLFYAAKARPKLAIRHLRQTIRLNAVDSNSVRLSGTREKKAISIALHFALTIQELMRSEVFAKQIITHLSRRM
jgi:hypothetical protein